MTGVDPVCDFFQYINKIGSVKIINVRCRRNLLVILIFDIIEYFRKHRQKLVTKIHNPVPKSVHIVWIPILNVGNPLITDRIVRFQIETNINLPSSKKKLFIIFELTIFTIHRSTDHIFKSRFSPHNHPHPVSIILSKRFYKKIVKF